MRPQNECKEAKEHGPGMTPGEKKLFGGMRAAVLLFSYYPDDPRPRRAAEALAENGMEVDVICLRQSANEPARECFNGVRILRIPLQRRRGGKLAYVMQYVAFILATFALMSLRSFRRPYHMVHVHNMPDILVFSALIPKLLGAKVLLDLHDPMPELMRAIYGLGVDSRGVRLLKLLEKWSTGFADAVLTVNLTCKNIFSSRSCPAEKISVIMNSPDERIFRFRPVNGECNWDSGRPFVIMYHGSIVERHGLDLAVEAMRRLRSSVGNVQLRIFGQHTAFLDQVLDSISGNGLRESIEYRGPMRIEQIAREIDSCDLGIIPNRRSIFTEINTPTRIFEYLSRGKPVIAPQAQGIQDYFDDSAIIYFELGNAEDLAQKIEQVYRSPEEARTTVIRGQQIYQSHLWSREKERFLGLITRLLARKS
jgi:glycosyltransferase involved in cell wall biosynthesis